MTSRQNETNADDGVIIRTPDSVLCLPKELDELKGAWERTKATVDAYIEAREDTNHD